MKKSFLLLTICGGVGLITYFLHRENPIAEKMKALYGMKISLPVEKMLLVYPNGKAHPHHDETKYKMIVFYDSLSCSPCVYKNMYIWNDFIEEANKEKGRIQFYFIMNPSQEDKDDLFKILQMPNGFIEPILIDTIGVFVEVNAFIPNDVAFHCLLLDSTDQIELIGDPTRNNRLKELYLNTISD